MGTSIRCSHRLFTGNSPFRSSPRRLYRLAAAALGLLAAASFGLPAASAAESVQFEIVPAEEALFLEPASGAEVMAPTQGQCVAVGRFDRLSARDISQITLLAPDGRQFPLIIESASIFNEFGKIAALRFCFRLSEAEARPGRGAFILQWGPEVKADNRQVDRFAFDPARRELYRSLRPKSAAGAGSNVATIEVIADSTAEYHFLWYLLPMALILVLLTVRKMRARDQAPRTGP